VQRSFLPSVLGPSSFCPPFSSHYQEEFFLFFRGAWAQFSTLIFECELNSFSPCCGKLLLWVLHPGFSRLPWTRKIPFHRFLFLTASLFAEKSPLCLLFPLSPLVSFLMDCWGTFSLLYFCFFSYFVVLPYREIGLVFPFPDELFLANPPFFCVPLRLRSSPFLVLEGCFLRVSGTRSPFLRFHRVFLVLKEVFFPSLNALSSLFFLFFSLEARAQAFFLEFLLRESSPFDYPPIFFPGIRFTSTPFFFDLPPLYRRQRPPPLNYPPPFCPILSLPNVLSFPPLTHPLCFKNIPIFPISLFFHHKRFGFLW